MTEQQIAFVKRVARNKVESLSFPQFSTCRRCYISNGKISREQMHTTQYDKWSGCFPLCEQCWLELGAPEARLPYYMELVESWRIQAPLVMEYGKRWELIEAAVMAGK